MRAPAYLLAAGLALLAACSDTTAPVLPGPPEIAPGSPDSPARAPATRRATAHQ